MAENGWLEDEISFWDGLFLRGYVSLKQRRNVRWVGDFSLTQPIAKLETFYWITSLKRKHN